MPPKKRASPARAALEAAEKRYKLLVDDVVTEWMCPITQELPIDPVTAEDGHVYEREAIAKHIQLGCCDGASLKSPMTNLPMGDRLLSSAQARNTIEKLVRSGAITGERAAKWVERLQDEDFVNET